MRSTARLAESLSLRLAESWVSLGAPEAMRLRARQLRSAIHFCSLDLRFQKRPSTLYTIYMIYLTMSSLDSIIYNLYILYGLYNMLSI